MIAYLGFYDPPFAQSANDALWRVLRDHAVALGLSAPAVLDRDSDYRAIWTAPALAFAQTCGLPLTTSLLRAHSGPYYRSYFTVAARFLIVPHNTGFNTGFNIGQ